MIDLKKIFRYPFSTVLLIVGMVLVMITFICGYSITSYMRYYEKESKEYEYKIKQTINIDLLEYDKSKEFIADLQAEECNVYFDDDMVWLDSAENYVVADIILYNNEKFNYCLESGRYPTKEEIKKHEKVIDIGRGRLNATYVKNKEKYIKIYGEEYKVIGIIGTPHTNYQDYKMCLFYECTGKEFKAKYYENSFKNITVASNSDTADVSGVKQTIIDKLQETEGISFSETTVMQKNGAEEKDIYMNLFTFLFIVCVTNCVIISELWLQNRKKEFVIRYTYGFSEFQMFKLIFVDYMKISIISVVIGELLILIINPLLKNNYGISTDFSVSNYAAVFLMYIIVSALLSLIMIRKIEKNNIVDNMNVNKKVLQKRGV